MPAARIGRSKAISYFNKFNIFTNSLAIVIIDALPEMQVAITAAVYLTLFCLMMSRRFRQAGGLRSREPDNSMEIMRI